MEGNRIESVRHRIRRQACALAALAALGLGGRAQAVEAPAVTPANQAQALQRLVDLAAIQELMSRHAWYYSAGQHQRELDELFTMDQPDVSFGTNAGYWVGAKSLQYAYVDWFERQARKDLAALSKRHPEIKDVPENLLAGTMMIHTLTTPLIVVAGDGKTAKGLFYSPGQVTQTPLGQPSANYMWERYAIDFIKEGDDWRIWHFTVYTDFSVPPGGDWTKPTPAGAQLVVQPGEVLPWEDPEAPKFDAPGSGYQSYGIDVVRGEKPKIPVPYRTFSETFSYGAPAKAGQP
ncbi:MAG: nuclear transport factor 2 family protein [Pseudoxanthomonas sp.]